MTTIIIVGAVCLFVGIFIGVAFGKATGAVAVTPHVPRDLASLKAERAQCLELIKAYENAAEAACYRDERQRYVRQATAAWERSARLLQRIREQELRAAAELPAQTPTESTAASASASAPAPATSEATES